MSEKKIIFVAYAPEDVRQRDVLTIQALNTMAPFEYVGMPVKNVGSAQWQEEVRALIRQSSGVIALVSKHSPDSAGQKWEVACAREEQKRTLGVWAYQYDRTALEGVGTVSWTWDVIEDYINAL